MGHCKRTFKKGSDNFSRKLRRPGQTSHGHGVGARAAQTSAVTDAEQSGTNDDKLPEIEKKEDERFEKQRAEKADRAIDEAIRRDRELEQEDDRRKAFKHTIHMIQSFNHETASTDGDQPREHQPHEHDEH